MEEREAIRRYQAPELGDLVLRRRFNVDKSLGMKLHTKWDGPYLLSRVSKSGVSGELMNLRLGKVIGRSAFECLKVFVPGEQSPEAEGWVTLAEGLGNPTWTQEGAVSL